MFKKSLVILIKLLIASLIFVGIDDILKLQSQGNDGNYLWQFILFAFLIGSFILSIRTEFILKDQIKIFPKVSFLLILSSIMILIIHGFSIGGSGGVWSQETDLKIITVFVSLGFFIFCYGITDFIFQLTRIILFKK